MKTLNFTCQEILPSLLDKSKTQTIRAAFEKDRVQPEIVGYVCKPAKFKVGDKAKLMWKQTERFSSFCKNCGKGVSVRDKLVNYCSCGNDLSNSIFNKYLGEVEITEVFKISLGKSKSFKKNQPLPLDFVGKKPYEKHWELTVVVPKDIQFYAGAHGFRPSEISEGYAKSTVGKPNELAKRDGFKSAKEMFEYFNRNYDLSSPKEFWVYRWKWL